MLPSVGNHLCEYSLFPESRKPELDLNVKPDICGRSVACPPIGRTSFDEGRIQYQRPMTEICEQNRS